MKKIFSVLGALVVGSLISDVAFAAACGVCSAGTRHDSDCKNETLVTHCSGSHAEVDLGATDGALRLNIEELIQAGYTINLTLPKDGELRLDGDQVLFQGKGKKENGDKDSGGKSRKK